MATKAEADQALRDQAEEFASRIVSVLDATVASDPPVEASRHENRLVVAPTDDRPVTLTHNGHPVVDLRFHYFCSWDSYESYLAVQKSKIRLCVHEVREPLIRFEYERARQDGLDAHIHVHAENTGLGWLSAKTGSPRNPRLQSIHLPVGGDRFRTSLEDVIEMAIRDLAVDAKPQWWNELRASRDEWLITQTKAAVRRRPEPAANTLRELGWTLTPPAADEG